MDAALDDLEHRVSELEKSGGPAVHEVVKSQTALRGSLNALSADIERVVSDIRTVTPPSLSESTIDAISLRARTRADSFYERFEDAMRGSAESVKERLEPYLADLDARRSVGGTVLDIGCGRGEWLELVQENGFDALGIDFNGEAVARCTARGLKAVQGDAIAYLRDIEASSLLAVTGFHIVEHLDPDVQIELVEAAWRALRPGGLLILETPNPTNLTVGAASFYSDPSHLRPVDPDYLYYLYGDVGFVGVEARFLNPREDYEPVGTGATDLEDEMMRALRGPRDFSVIGRKPGVADATP
jgi:O-antigen chain-terminating methyltransferase